VPSFLRKRWGPVSLLDLIVLALLLIALIAIGWMMIAMS